MGQYSPEQQSLGSPLHQGSHPDLLFYTRLCSLIYMMCRTALGLELEVKFVIPVVILKYVYNTPETNIVLYINCISVKKILTGNFLSFLVQTVDLNEHIQLITKMILN